MADIDPSTHKNIIYIKWRKQTTNFKMGLILDDWILLLVILDEILPA